MVRHTECFHFQNPGHEAVQFQATLAEPLGQPQRLALVVLILDAGHQLLGFWRKTFWRTASRELECHFDIMKTGLDYDAIRGISKAIKPYFDQLNHTLGVAREFVEADWIGRLVWADFYDLDETHFYLENGHRRCTLDVMRRNFDRFLTWHRLRCSDLILATPSGQQPLTHPEQLTSPGDFARIAHRAGNLVRVDVLLDDLPRRLERRALPVGRAFMLADFTDVRDNTVELIDGYYGERLCDRAMPYWFGVKQQTRRRSLNPQYRFERHEIVIVGAGLAGLTAAARLEKAGLQPVVYEANPSRIGGRLHSLALKRRAGQLYLDDRPIASESTLPATATQDDILGVIEAGGEFVGHHHKALHGLAKALGLDLIKVEPPLLQSHVLVSPAPGTVQTLVEFASQYRPLIDRLRRVWKRWQHDGLSPRLAALSLDRFLAWMEAPVSFRNVIQGTVRGQYGAEMNQISLGHWFDMQPFDGHGAFK